MTHHQLCPKYPKGFCRPATASTTCQLVTARLPSFGEEMRFTLRRPTQLPLMWVELCWYNVTVIKLKQRLKGDKKRRISKWGEPRSTNSLVLISHARLTRARFVGLQLLPKAVHVCTSHTLSPDRVPRKRFFIAFELRWTRIDIVQETTAPLKRIRFRKNIQIESESIDVQTTLGDRISAFLRKKKRRRHTKVGQRAEKKLNSDFLHLLLVLVSSCCSFPGAPDTYEAAYEHSHKAMSRPRKKLIAAKKTAKQEKPGEGARRKTVFALAILMHFRVLCFSFLPLFAPLYNRKKRHKIPFEYFIFLMCFGFFLCCLQMN